MSLQAENRSSVGKRVAIYARYSSELQNPRSVADQIQICIERSDREGWSVYECYSDSAMSGTNMERPGLQQLLRDAREARFEVVLAEALDRLSRDQADTATIFKQMQFARIDIVTLSEGRVGIIDVGLRGTMNQLSSIETGNKVRRGQGGRIKEGRQAGGIAYGYDMMRRLDLKGELIRGERNINEYQARVVRRIFQSYASGDSPRTIAVQLNNEGVPGPAGRGWRPNTIIGNPRLRIGILNNEIYIGELVWNHRTNIRHPETGRRVQRVNPESEWIRTKAPALQIVDRELWEKVRERQREQSCPRSTAALATMKRLGIRRPRYLLSGLVKCGCCGGGFSIRRGTRFSCANFDNRGTCANDLRIEHDNLEDKVLSALKQRLSDNPERCIAFCEAYARRLKDARSERDALIQACRQELDHLESEFHRLIGAPKHGSAVDERETALASVVAHRQRLARLLAQAMASVDALENHYREHVGGLVDTLGGSHSNRDSYEAFRWAIGQVVVRPDEEGTGLVVNLEGGPPRKTGRPKKIRNFTQLQLR